MALSLVRLTMLNGNINFIYHDNYTGQRFFIFVENVQSSVLDVALFEKIMPPFPERTVLRGI